MDAEHKYDHHKKMADAIRAAIADCSPNATSATVQAALRGSRFYPAEEKINSSLRSAISTATSKAKTKTVASEPTVVNLTTVNEWLKGDSVDEVLERMRDIQAIASKVGSFASFLACLEALKMFRQT